MSAVLDFFRQQEPKFKDVSDSDLTRFVALNHPDFLKDEDFSSDWESVNTRGIQETLQRQQLSAAPNQPFSSEAGTGLTEAIGESSGRGLEFVGNVARAIPADLAAGLSLLKRPEGQPPPLLPSLPAMAENLPYATQASGNIPAALTGQPMPIDREIAEAAKESPGAALTARLSQDLAATAPLAAVGLLPASAARLVTAGFTVDMIRHAPELFDQYGEEINKPKDQQDPDKLARLQSGILQTFAFAPLAGAHATGKSAGQMLGDVAVAFDNAKRVTPEAPRFQQANETVNQALAKIESPVTTAVAAEAAATGSPKTAAALLETSTVKEPNAIQEPVPAESLLRQERPEVELPAVAEGSPTPGQAVAEVAPKAGEALTEPPSLNAPVEPRPGTPLAETKPMGTQPVGEQIPPAAPDLAAKLEALKFKDDPGLGKELYTLRPDLLQKVGKQLWNDAIDLAIAGIKAGKVIGEAVNDAIAHIRSKVKDVDEAGLREGFKDIFAKEPVVVPKTTGESVKMRKSAERAVESPDIPEPVQERIAEAPESRYTQQSMQRVEDVVTGMTEAELGAVPSESNLYTAAKLEQAKRLFDAGNHEAGYQVFVELEKQGTRFGQLINQFKMLAGTRPENVVLAINKHLEKAGRDPLTEAQAAKALELATDSKAKDAALDKATDAWTKDPTDANAAKADAAHKAANDAALELQRFVGKFQPRLVASILKSVLQGNLLTPISEVANVVGNLSFLPFRGGTRAAATGLDILDNFMRGKGREITVSPIAGSVEALKGAGRGLSRVPQLLKRGTGETVQGETRAGLHPLRAWINQFAKNPELPTKGGKLTFGDRVGLAIEGTFGVPAEAMLRGLGAGDLPFREAARSRIIANELKLAKVPREKWAMAKKFPELVFDRETMQRIGSETAAAIFQRDSTTLNFLTKWLRGKGELVDLIAATVAPYKLTPWNIIGEIMSYNPLIAAAKTGIEAKRGNSRLAKMNAGKLVVGSMLTATGWWLYKNGLMAPSLDQKDEAQKARMLLGETLPPNHINISGLKRALTRLSKGESVTPEDTAMRSGDETRDVFRAGGLAGAMFYMTANIGRDMERKPQAGGEDALMSLITQSGLEQARFGMNQSFLQGVEGMLSAVKDGSADNYLKKWGSTFMSIPLPNTLNTITKASQKYQTDVRDDGFFASVDKAVSKKLGFIGVDDYLPLRRGLWGEPLLETPKDRNALVYHFFDIGKGRQMTDDPKSLELYRLWRKTGDTKVIPSIPTKELTVQNKTYQLNPQQYSRLVELIGQSRLPIADAMVVNPEYHKLTDEQRVMILDRAYEAGRQRGVGLFIQENPITTLTSKPRRAGF